MKTREYILTEVYNSNILKKMANKYASKLKGDIDDFVSHCLLIICEIPEDKLVKLYNDNQLYFYVVKIANNQCWNDKSTFNKELGIATLPLHENNSIDEEDDNA